MSLEIICINGIKQSVQIPEGTYQLRFTDDTGTGYMSDMALDHIITTTLTSYITNNPIEDLFGSGITSQQLADAGYDADAVLAAGYPQAEVDATTFASATVPGCTDSNASNYYS